MLGSGLGFGLGLWLGLGLGLGLGPAAHREHVERLGEAIGIPVEHDDHFPGRGAEGDHRQARRQALHDAEQRLHAGRVQREAPQGAQVAQSGSLLRSRGRHRQQT